MHRFVVATLIVALLLPGLPARAADEPGASVAPAFNRALPNVPGKSLIAVVVTYPPGAQSPSHRHTPSAFIAGYVLAGAIRSAVDDGPEQVYKAGESFFETPGQRHRVSANASATEPARLLAIFVVDTGETPLTSLEPR